MDQIMTTDHIVGAALMALPLIGMTIGMVRTIGVNGMAVVWISTAGTVACVWVGATLLTR